MTTGRLIPGTTQNIRAHIVVYEAIENRMQAFIEKKEEENNETKTKSRIILMKQQYQLRCCD